MLGSLGPGCRERQGWGFLSSATPQLLGELTPWCCHRGIPQPWSPSNRDRAVGCTWASCVPREGGSMHAWKGEHGVQAPSPAQLGNLTRRGWGKCGQVAGKPLGQCILPWAQTVRGREGSWGPGTLSGELPGVTQAPPTSRTPLSPWDTTPQQQELARGQLLDPGGRQQSHRAGRQTPPRVLPCPKHTRSPAKGRAGEQELSWRGATA